MKKQEQSVKNGHIRSGILIGLWFLLLAVPVWFVNTTAGYFGTIFAILLVLFSFGILFILKRSVAVEASFLDMACIRGKRVDIGLFIRNRSPFIAPRAHTTFFLSDLFDRPAQKKGIDFVVGGKARNDFSFRTQMNHIGVFRVGMDDLRIWDMFGLVSIRIPVQIGRAHV